MNFHHFLPLFFVLISIFGKTQNLNIPRSSPKASVAQYVGVCQISVDYNRPSVKSRRIFGDLVPFGEVWRAGANEATVISFSHPVTFGGAMVAPGRFSLVVTPGKDIWTINLNKDWNQWGAYHHDPTKKHRPD